MEDSGKYEWDGPKNQMDADQLSDFYEKLINDHPLLEYIEDCFAFSDIKGIKKFQAKMKEKHQDKIKIGVNALFESNFEKIKEYTLLIQEESEDEEDEPTVEEEEKPPAVEEAPPVPEPEDTKESKKSAAGKKRPKKGEVEEKPVEVEDPNKKPDPNVNKLIPSVVHLRRDLLNTIYQNQQIINYCQTLKSDESFCL